MYTNYIRPGLDWLLALSGLFILFPLFLAVILMLVFTTGLNPIFRQQRIGYQGKLFGVYKFRTMTNASDLTGNLLSDTSRVTPIGRWLRRTSIDELPQLFNVLLGDMSLIGPRPLLAEYAPKLAMHERHTILPGLTGWAQIHGRNHLSWDEKFALDSWYVNHCSLSMDCLILWQTLFVLIDDSPPAKPLTPCYFTEPEATPVS